jgi:hypothetical protein
MPVGGASGGDNLARIKAEYQEQGTAPSHVRYGWVHPRREA